MANIAFFGQTSHIQAFNGSGIAFMGSSFGSSVDVAAYQTTSWISNSNGTAQGPQLNNIAWTHPNSGSINGGASIAVSGIPNYLATINPRFTHSTAIKTQNVKFRVYDRVSINNDPSGVLCKVAELIHPETSQAVPGSGANSWSTPTGSSNIMSLASSPGLSGLSPNGPSTTDMTHDWYLAISASPNSIGSKTFAGYLSLEYL